MVPSQKVPISHCPHSLYHFTSMHTQLSPQLLSPMEYFLSGQPTKKKKKSSHISAITNKSHAWKAHILSLCFIRFIIPISRILLKYLVWSLDTFYPFSLNSHFFLVSLTIILFFTDLYLTGATTKCFYLKSFVYLKNYSQLPLYSIYWLPPWAIIIIVMKSPKRRKTPSNGHKL